MSMVKCVSCGGSGIDGPGESPCQACGGDGHVKVPDPPTACGRCKGRGRLPGAVAGRDAVCIGCQGTGWAT